MQLITPTNCPTSRTRVYDARDNHSYYVQKLADGKCWMLTNLAYAGGGDNTYGDTKTLSSFPASSGTTATNSTPQVVTDIGGQPITSEPTNPSTATGIYTGQYGYLYNWCAAMGGQSVACNTTEISGFDTAVSVCPAGWRLPTGGEGGDFQILNNTVNSGSLTSDADLRAVWLNTYSGYYYGTLYNTGWSGDFWSATARAEDASYAYYLTSNNSTINPVANTGKYFAFSVRCIL